MLNYFDIILNKMQFDKMVKGQVFRATTQKKMEELLSSFKFIYYKYLKTIKIKLLVKAESDTDGQ